MTFPKCLAAEKQRPKRDKVLWSEFDKWCFGVAVIELLNLLIFQMMFALPRPYVLRARERSLEASDRGHVWVTVVLVSDVEVSQLKGTPSARCPESLATEQSGSKSPRPI